MTATPDIQHQPWCDHHVAPSRAGSMEFAGWCEAALWRQGGDDSNYRPELTLQQDGGEGGPIMLSLESPGQTVLEPHEARQLAAALLDGADLLESVRTPLGPHLPTDEETAALIRLGDEIMRNEPNEAGREAARRLDSISAAAIARRAVRDVS